jgi:secreted trypsin-like serine protease
MTVARQALALGALAILGAPAGALAIVGGQPIPGADGGALAYVTAADGDGVGECSAALIGPRTLLTAAHCVRDERTGAFRTLVGRTAFIGATPGSSVARTVTGVEVNPRFQPRQPRNGWDLAVLTLDRPVRRAPLRLLTPAEEATAGAKPPSRVVVSGFGVRRDGQPVGRRPARRVSLELLSPFNCASGTALRRLQASQACAAIPSGATCAGDSGGPGVVTVRGQRRLYGVVSLALQERPCAPGNPAILARVAPARAWIVARAG